jgi:hypothetical protein
VEISGACRAHGELIADAQAMTAQLRAAAIDASDGQAWIEKVKLRTSPLRDASARGLAAGPIEEMRRYLGELRCDHGQLAELSAELADFYRKLPGELFQGEDGLPVNDPAFMEQCLGDVESLLVSRMSGALSERS